MNAATTGSACFIADEYEDLCLLTDMETGFPPNLHHHHLHSNAAFLSGATLRGAAPLASAFSSPKWVGGGGGGRWFQFHDVGFGFEGYRLGGHREHPHFLESCFLCCKRLGDHRDIFMYRGDKAFCSEECRQMQIEMDEARERKWNLSSSMKALRMQVQSPSSPSPSSSSTSAQAQDQHLRTRPVVAV